MPGWHETVFPPYFVAGAIFSGFAMVIVLSIAVRLAYGLQDFITRDHLDVMGKLLLATSLITSYGYLSEQTITYYGGDVFDVHVYWYRLMNFDKYAWIVWISLYLQYARAATAVVSAAAPQPGGVVRGFARRAGRHVARAVHDHHQQLERGFLAVVVWILQADGLGHSHLRRLNRIFPGAVPAVRALLAPDVDLRNQGFVAGSAWPGGRAMSNDLRDSWLDGAVPHTQKRCLLQRGAARQAGYRTMDAYTPYTVEGSRSSWECGARGFRRSY